MEKNKNFSYYDRLNLLSYNFYVKSKPEELFKFTRLFQQCRKHLTFCRIYAVFYSLRSFSQQCCFPQQCCFSQFLQFISNKFSFYLISSSSLIQTIFTNLNSYRFQTHSSHFTDLKTSIFIISQFTFSLSQDSRFYNLIVHSSQTHIFIISQFTFSLSQDSHFYNLIVHILLISKLAFL